MTSIQYKNDSLLLSKLMRVSKDIIIILSHDYEIIEINPTLRKIVPDTENIIGKNFFEYCEDKPILLTKIELNSLLSDNKLEKGISSSNGEFYCFSWSLHKISSDDSNSSILLIANDITDTRRVSFLNKENQTQLERISEVVPGNFYWKNTKGEYLGCNLSLLTMLGMHSIKDIIGKNDFDLWPEQADEIKSHDKQVMISKKPVYTEESVKMAGRNMFFAVIKMPLFGENDQVIGILGNSLDITKQKEMEEDLKNAKIAAEAGEKAKDEIIANFSHDMRTPLSGIISDAHQLEEDDISQETRKELAVQLADAGGALLEMFEETLENVAADHMTEKDIELETFDIKLLIDKLIKLEKPSVTQKGLKLLSNIDPNIPQFLVNDRKKIHRILLNLIGNAIKFTKQGHIELKIELIGIHKDQSQVTLKFNVIDTGIGVPEKSKQHLFERFFKGSSSYKAEYKGYGLGLNIAKTYTHLLGGTISFESTEGVGSEFYAILTLKIANEHEIASYQEKIAKKPSLLTMNTDMKLKPTHEHKPATDVKPSETESIPGAPHVLIVEDNLMLRKTTVKLVKKAMLNVTAVDDGLPALELAKNQHFDLILSDVGLLTMSGTEFAQKLRAFEKENNLPTVPIIGVTAHAADGRGECLSAGMNAVTQKPFLKETLVEILKQFLPDHKLPKN